MSTNNIADFVAAQGGQAACARALQVTPGLIHQWLNGIRPVSPKFALRIEAMSNGAVRCSDLRPDIWPPVNTSKRGQRVKKVA